MGKENISLEVALQYRGIELSLSNIFYHKVSNNNTVFNFDINSEIQVTQENKILFVIINVKIYDSEKLELLGDIATSSIFHIENFEDVLINKYDGNLVVNDNLIINLNSIAFSTTRGVMWSTFKGTVLHNAILPIIDSTQFLSQTYLKNEK